MRVVCLSLVLRLMTSSQSNSSCWSWVHVLTHTLTLPVETDDELAENTPTVGVHVLTHCLRWRRTRWVDDEWADVHFYDYIDLHKLINITFRYKYIYMNFIGNVFRNLQFPCFTYYVTVCFRLQRHTPPWARPCRLHSSFSFISIIPGHPTLGNEASNTMHCYRYPFFLPKIYSYYIT